MFELTPSYFFDLSSYEHASLFKGIKFVWEAFKKIDPYLKSVDLGKIDIEIPSSAHIIHPELISIGKGTIVEETAYIKGPCIIGENSVIRHGAYIRGSAIIGNHCVVGHDTEVKEAIFLDYAHAAHFAYVGNSVLGNRVNLGAGTKCANLKFDGKNIAFRYKDEEFQTNLRKFGAIVGDDAQLGCNSVANPGTLLGKGSFCYPCVSFGGFLPEKHIVKSSSQVIMKSKERLLK